MKHRRKEDHTIDHLKAEGPSLRFLLSAAQKKFNFPRKMTEKPLYF